MGCQPTKERPVVRAKDSITVCGTLGPEETLAAHGVVAQPLSRPGIHRPLLAQPGDIGAFPLGKALPVLATTRTLGEPTVDKIREEMSNSRELIVREMARIDALKRALEGDAVVSNLGEGDTSGAAETAEVKVLDRRTAPGGTRGKKYHGDYGDVVIFGESDKRAALMGGKLPWDMFVQRAGDMDIFQVQEKRCLRITDDDAYLLLVEPNEVFRAISTVMLHRMGCQVKAFGTSEEMIRMLGLSLGKFDLILVDVTNSTLESATAVVSKVHEQLRKEEKTNVNVIGTCTHWSPELREMCAKAGMRELFVKPFSRDDIANALNNFLACDVDAQGNPTPYRPADRGQEERRRGAPMIDSGPDDAIRCMLVEDSPTSLKHQYHLVSLLECDVTCMVSAEAAVRSLRHYSMDIIFLDLFMPGMNGYEAARWITEECAPSNIPIMLAITANTSSGMMQRCHQAGMKGYMTKPPTVEKFARSLVQVLLQPGMRPGMRALLEPCVREMMPVASDAKGDSTEVFKAMLGDWGHDLYQTVAKMNMRAAGVFTEMCIEVVRQHGLVEAFSIEEAKLRSFLTHIGMKYSPEASFHNVVKAMASVKAMHFFLDQGGLKHQMTPLQTLALLLTSMVHGVDHPGVNNGFVKRFARAAMMREDCEEKVPERSESVNEETAAAASIEQHYVSICFAALEMPALNFLSSMDESSMLQLRMLVETFIMSMDMAHHAAVIQEWHDLSSVANQDLVTESKSLVLCKLAVKCADVSIHAMPANIMRQGTSLLFQELHEQGDRERAAGLPISPLCDRDCFDTVDAVECYLAWVVAPLFQCFCGALALPVVEEICMRQLQQNIADVETIFHKD